MRDADAERAMVARLENDVDATCALDVAEDGPIVDSAIALYTGVTPQRIAQIAAEANHRLKLAIRGEERSHGTRQKHRAWTEAMRQKARELRDAGLSIRAIADRVGASETSVQRSLSGEPLFERKG